MLDGAAGPTPLTGIDYIARHVVAREQNSLPCWQDLLAMVPAVQRFTSATPPRTPAIDVRVYPKAVPGASGMPVHHDNFKRPF